MGKFKAFFLFGLLCFTLKNTCAQTGCIGSITGDLYLTNTSGTNYSYSGAGVTSSNIYSTYCIESIGSNGTCTIVGVPFFGSVSGSLTTYSLPAGCPLDDYIIPFALGLSILSFYFMRKQKMQALMKFNNGVW